MGYAVLRLIHIIGFILLGGGLVGVFTADLRSRQAQDVKVFAEACRFVAVFYDCIVIPGAILAGLSGLVLTIQAKSGFFQMPWHTGMWTLFLFEFVEGNTITRIHFRRMLKLSKGALAQGEITSGLLREQARKLPTYTHFLDLPLFFVIVSFGALRPLTWAPVAYGVMLALLAAAALFLLTGSIFRKNKSG